MFVNSNNALLLAQELEKIPNAKQVRFNYVLREDLVETKGANSIVYIVFVDSLDQSNAAAIGSKVYEKFRVVVEESTYEDVTNHGIIQSMMNERIGHYYRTSEKINNVGEYSFPFKYDADGNVIPYEMSKNNPIRP
jgi:hypothetical protein